MTGLEPACHVTLDSNSSVSTIPPHRHKNDRAQPLSAADYPLEFLQLYLPSMVDLFFTLTLVTFLGVKSGQVFYRLFFVLKRWPLPFPHSASSISREKLFRCDYFFPADFMYTKKSKNVQLTVMNCLSFYSSAWFSKLTLRLVNRTSFCIYNESFAISWRDQVELNSRDAVNSRAH